MFKPRLSIRGQIAAAHARAGLDFKDTIALPPIESGLSRIPVLTYQTPGGHRALTTDIPGDDYSPGRGATGPPAADPPVPVHAPACR